MVDGLRAVCVKVLLTTCNLPPWATDHYWRKHPPQTYPEGPQTFYRVQTSAPDDHVRLGRWLALHLRGRVRAPKCWNEPNLWPFLYS